MAQFGWAYINCSQTGSDGSGSGPPHSLQFVTESGGGTTGPLILHIIQRLIWATHQVLWFCPETCT